MKKALLSLLLAFAATAAVHAQDVQKGIPANAKGTPGKTPDDYEIVNHDASWTVYGDFTHEDNDGQMYGKLNATNDEDGSVPPVPVGYYAFMHETVKGSMRFVFYITNSRHVLVGRCAYDPIKGADSVVVEVASDGKKITLPVGTGNVSESDIATALSRAGYL